MEKNNDLHWRFINLWNDIGATTNATKVFNKIVDKYSEAHRRYHVVPHLRHGFSKLDLVPFSIPNRDCIEYGFWNHDWEYNTRRHDNEVVSADHAEQEAIEARLPKSFIVNSRRLIMSTIHNYLPKREDEKYIVDIDLAILGESLEVFDQYELDIRMEYEWVDELLYVRERSKILEQFLNRPRIYSTDFFFELYERTARENLKRSISKLRGVK